MQLLICRRWNGIGDWLMTATVIRHINMLHPEIEVLLSSNNAPWFVIRYLNRADISFTYYDPAIHKPDCRIEHLGYPTSGSGPRKLLKCSKHFIAHMLDMVNRVCKTKMEFSYEHLARLKDFTINPEKNNTVVISPGASRIMVNTQMQGQSSKHWGINNFLALTELLASKYEVIQIGSKMDHPLPKAKHMVAQDLNDCVEYMNNAKHIIFQAGGLAHLAAHLDLPAHVIYRGQESTLYSGYPVEIPLMNPTPEEVFAYIEAN